MCPFCIFVTRRRLSPVLKLLTTTSDLSTLSALAKDGIILGQSKAIVNLVVLDSLDRLGATLFADWNGLDPRLDVLLACELQHGKHLWAVTNVRGTNVATVGSELLSHELRNWLVAKTDSVELAHDLEGGKVLVHVELVQLVGGVEDKVKLELVWVVPALFARDDKVAGSHLESVLLLVGAV